MKIALIANPHSGGKKGKKILPLVEKKLTDLHIEFKTFESLYHEHILKITSNLSIDQYDSIVALGGDGTNYHMLNGLLRKYKPSDLPPLGIIPVGSGNSFAKDLDMDNWRDGLRAVVEENTRKVDVCEYTQGNQTYYFVNLMGLGFVTDVGKTAKKFKMFKDFSYVIGVLHRTIALRFHYMELVVDGKSYSEENCFVEFCNSRYTGGNMLIAPDAQIDDGYMDIVIAKPLSRFEILTTLPKIYDGRHLGIPPVRVIKAKSASIKTWPEKTLLPDGEIFGSTPTDIKVHKQMVRYLT